MLGYLVHTLKGKAIHIRIASTDKHYNFFETKIIHIKCIHKDREFLKPSISQILFVDLSSSYHHKKGHLT